MGGKVLIPTAAHERNLIAARLAADVCGVPTFVMARTDAESARLITSDVDERRSTPMHGTHFWVVGGEFRSLDFHTLVHGSAQVEGPFPSRREAEECWRTLSEKNRHRCNVRFSIVEEPRRVAVA